MEHGTHKSDTDLPQETGSATTDPAATFNYITFSDGIKITLEPTDVVVLVGPNNAGKSVALLELERCVARDFEVNVVTMVECRRTGTIEELRTYLGRHTSETDNGQTKFTVGYLFTFATNALENFGLVILAFLAGFL